MRRLIALLALAFSGSAEAQLQRMGPGTNTAGYPVTLPDGNRVLVQTTTPVDVNGNPVVGGNTADAVGSGNLALATLNAAYVIPLSGGRNAVGLTINGLTGSGATITVERSNDGGTTWTSANTTESSASGSLSSAITANGQARVGVAGATNIRLRVSTAGTGNATVAYNATTAAGPVFFTSYLPSTTTPAAGVIGAVAGQASTPVQQGGTIAASGGTAAITFVNTNDTEIVNPSTATLWGSWGTPAVNGANSYPIAAGGSYRPPNRVAGTFTLLSTAANQTYTATRF